MTFDPLDSAPECSAMIAQAVAERAARALGIGRATVYRKLKRSRR